MASSFNAAGTFIEPLAKSEMLTAAEFGYPFLVDAQPQAFLAPSRKWARFNSIFGSLLPERGQAESTRPEAHHCSKTGTWGTS
jgi:hypothetical protein